MKLLTLLCAGLVAFAPQQSEYITSNTTDAVITMSAVIPLTHSAIIKVSEDCTIIVDPGIRGSRIENGYSLSSYDGKSVELEVGGEKVTLSSQAMIRFTGRQWDFGTGKTYFASSIIARRRPQDDTDSNLKSMQESAKKLKAKTQNEKPGKPGQKLRVRWIYGENAFATAESFNTQAIQQLVHLSAIGF